MKKSCARGSQICDFISEINKKAAWYLSTNSSPQDQTLANFIQRICNPYQRSCWGGSNSQVWGFVIGSRSHPREEGSCTGTPHKKKILPAEQKVNIQKFISHAWTLPCSIHPGEEAYTCFLTCNSPGHSSYHSCRNQGHVQNIGKCTFIILLSIWDTAIFKRYCRKHASPKCTFKGRIHEIFRFHKIGPHLQETFCLVDNFQEVLEFFFILAIFNHTPGTL